jgi:hypothetical protein
MRLASKDLGKELTKIYQILILHFHTIYLLSSCQAFLFTIHIFLTLKNLQFKNQYLDQGPIFLSKYRINLFMKLTSKQAQVSLPGDRMDVE